MDLKSRYDQHAFLIYQLIDQLDTPVLVFNKDDKLIYANGAFSLLYREPWQRYRFASPGLLGLEKSADSWQLQRAGSKWQISQSRFIDAGELHQLLVFTNIETAITATQLEAWQMMIRVIGHEVNNSLTPINTIAESLQRRITDKRDNDALQLIADRCEHLQDFISRYGSVSKPLQLACRNIDSVALVAELTQLFPALEITQDIKVKQIWADQSALEQVLINLLKNALEAEATRVTISISNQPGFTVLRLTDDGHGFADQDKILVPLFTTKENGQGLGLSLCRHIVSQHGGRFSIHNQSDSGVMATLTLPFQPGSESD